MTTTTTAEQRRKRPTSQQIPVLQYARFRLARTRESVEGLNQRFIQRELAKEKALVEGMAASGALTKENGAAVFKQMCERRLCGEEWERTRIHSVLVKDIAFKIAIKNEELRRSVGKRPEQVCAKVIANCAGNHDIGKTLIAPYLINREDGTVFGIGRGLRIDFARELPVLRLSHVEAGMQLLALFKDYINPEGYMLMKLLIGGHHIAYNGKGSGSAPSYPGHIGSVKVSEMISLKKGRVRNNQFPDIVKIVHTADVFCAALENRFYLQESERFMNMAKLVGVGGEEAALGLVIAVAGIDVSPRIVACLMMAMLDISYDEAKGRIRDLACPDASYIEKRGEDIKYTLSEVIKKGKFRHILAKKKEDWKDKMDTGLFLLADVFA